VPTYQYCCRDCGEPLEVVQSFTDDALTICPACGGALRKVFSPVGVVFKGSGFYRTDSRTEPADSKPEKKADTKSEGTGDKTETKTEPKSDKPATTPAKKSESSTSTSSAA
jgi:putative FmdB family regulatory protein